MPPPPRARRRAGSRHAVRAPASPAAAACIPHGHQQLPQRAPQPACDPQMRRCPARSSAPKCLTKHIPGRSRATAFPPWASPLRAPPSGHPCAWASPLRAPQSGRPCACTAPRPRRPPDLRLLRAPTRRRPRGIARAVSPAATVRGTPRKSTEATQHTCQHRSNRSICHCRGC
eukprot:357240-Chlamydomonas_euryale.AAC.1